MAQSGGDVVVAHLNRAQGSTPRGNQKNVPPFLYVLTHRGRGTIAKFETLGEAKRQLNEILSNERAWTGDFTIEPRRRGVDELLARDQSDGGVDEARERHRPPDG